MKTILFICLCLFWRNGIAENYLLPQPQQLQWNSGKFKVGKLAVIVQTCREEAEKWVNEAGGEINENAGQKLEIRLVKEIPGIAVNSEEAYRLTVGGESILIEAVTEKGAYWGIQTLRQLTSGEGKKQFVRGCQMTDWPAFRIRGFMHDVGRGYIPVEELKKEIELLSRYKVNVFHWHLTEDLAWRLESRIFPMLNDSVNFGRYPGKYYTLKEVRELVDFCREHQVLLIPEVDMPGHSAAFRKTFRHDMQSPEGMAILKLLMDEICEAFREVPYIHIGTDEVQLFLLILKPGSAR